MPNNFDARAVLNRMKPRDEEMAESPMMEAAEESVPHGKTEEEKFEHHRKMMKSASSPGARMMHKKLMAHHKSKMDP